MQHPFDFDPTHGYSLASLLAIQPPEPPEGFADFWRETYREAVAVDPAPERRACDFSRWGGEVYEVRYESWRGRRVGGWMVVPPDPHPSAGMVIGHGYGGRTAPEVEAPFGDSLVRFYPCAPGFHLSACDDLPVNDGHRHVLCGIESRETYVIRDCVAALWCAASAVQQLYPTLTTLYYEGGSFGGGLGALALPWEPRFRRGLLRVPTFGHHPLRLQCPGVGSGEAVRAYARRKRDPLPVLRWFDAATAASFIRVPTLTVPACFDPAVPPPGQFAVANAIHAPGSIVCVHRVGHFQEHPTVADDVRRYEELADGFLAAELPG